MTTICGGASTYSRQATRRPIGNPYTSWASGCKEFLSDGTELISWVMGLHGATLGYDPDYMRAALSDFSKHMVTSFPPEIEKEAAELIGKCCPGVESVKFSKNGSDVCSAAVRLARAITNREPICSCGYHGFGAEFAEKTSVGGVQTFGAGDMPDRGVPQCQLDLLHQFEWNDHRGLGEAAKDAACVIVEVPPTDDGEETAQFLQRCKDTAHENGALFILDEIVTGFRFALGGAAEHYSVTPDIYLYGKAMSNGYACSAIGGRNELMQEFQRGVFFSSTFADDPLGLMATYATLLQLIAREDEVYPHIWNIGKLLKDGINQLASQYGVDVKCVGQAPRTVLQWKDPKVGMAFTRECLARGVLLDRPQFSTLSHDLSTVNQTLGVVEVVFKDKCAHS